MLNEKGAHSRDKKTDEVAATRGRKWTWRALELVLSWLSAVAKMIPENLRSILQVTKSTKSRQQDGSVAVSLACIIFSSSACIIFPGYIM